MTKYIIKVKAIYELPLINCVTGKKSASHDNSMLFGAHGMKVQTTPSDGNCLFSAISLHLILCGINKSAATVRTELVSFMSQNQDKVT